MRPSVNIYPPSDVPPSGCAGQVDHHGLAADSRTVVDPGFDLGRMLPGGSAIQVERVRDAVRADDAAMRTREGVLALHPALTVRAGKAEPLGILARIGVVDVEVNPRALLVRAHAGNPRHGRSRGCGR